ncbi:MAG: hypothetical protein KIT79_12085 [Deltaproteobacteria bacterium]|nr:hypothetical protein [Deltaproteobacteria bacterium]
MAGPANSPSYGAPIVVSVLVAIAGLGTGGAAWWMFTSSQSPWRLGSPGSPAEAAPPAAAVPAQPVVPVEAPVPVPEPVPAAPDPEPPPVAAAPVQKWPQKVIGRKLNPAAASTITVQGSETKRMRSAAVDELVPAVFSGLPVPGGMKNVPAAGISAIKSAIDRAISESTVEEAPEGIKMAFSANMAAVRQTLAGRGFHVNTSWKLELNVVRNLSFSSTEDVQRSVRKSFEGSVPYAIGGEFRTTPERLAADLENLRARMADFPYKVIVKSQKVEGAAVRLDIEVVSP